MDSKIHIRKRSEIGRTRFLSDVYFENKQQKKRSASWAKESFAQTPTDMSDALIDVDELKNVQKLITAGVEYVRPEEIPLFEAFFCIVENQKRVNKKSLTLQETIQKLRSKDFRLILDKAVSVIPKKPQIHEKDSLHLSVKLYSQINKALYSSPLTKLISSFIENSYKKLKIVFRSVKFIEYFENLPSPSCYLSSPLNWGKLFTPDVQIETTKDDEENLYTNTLGDEKEFESLLDGAVQVLNTEPDCRNTLVSMFFQKYSEKNPYLRQVPIKPERVILKQERGKVGSQCQTVKWDKYFSESIYLKKLAQGFVSFVLAQGECWKAEEMDLVTWVYKNRNELVDLYLRTSADCEVGAAKHQAMIKHLSDKKTLRDLFKHC